MPIPPNDPKAPRWLLDLQQWKTVPYADVPKDVLDVEGYGIVSYTWGYILDKSKPATDPPEGLLWDVPSVTKWPLSKAREVMQKIGTRYVWWDWMCVPQRGKQPLNKELQEVQGQEIGKQMHIYGAAKRSIVWLHSTTWSKSSALKDLLRLQSPESRSQDHTLLQEHVDNVKSQLNKARSEEFWLCSGWTLQEGVLLSETDLVDGEGKVLSGQEFWLANQATVSDLTVPISRVAYELAIAYFIKSQGHEPDMGTPSPSATHLLSQAPEIWLRRSLQAFLHSGLVNFWKQSPLYILCGKQSRGFYDIRDSCWALIGALGITDIDVTYDKNVSMDEVKGRLLRALVDKYQWEMLMLPFLRRCSGRDEEQYLPGGDFRWTDVVDGVILPVPVFPVEIQSIADGAQIDMPTLIYTDEMRIKANVSKTFTVYRPSPEGAKGFRHYQQDKDGLAIISADAAETDNVPSLSTSWLLPLQCINMKVGVPGNRCLLLQNLAHPPDHAPAQATFGGIIDIVDLGKQQLHLQELLLSPR